MQSKRHMKKGVGWKEAFLNLKGFLENFYSIHIEEVLLHRMYIIYVTITVHIHKQAIIVLILSLTC